MLDSKATLIFWAATLSIVVSQVMILISTRRAFAAGKVKHPILEWGFAIVPAIALALLLYFSWRAATSPPIIEVQFGQHAGEIRS